MEALTYFVVVVVVFRFRAKKKRSRRSRKGVSEPRSRRGKQKNSSANQTTPSQLRILTSALPASRIVSTPGRASASRTQGRERRPELLIGLFFFNGQSKSEEKFGLPFFHFSFSFSLSLPASLALSLFFPFFLSLLLSAKSGSTARRSHIAEMNGGSTEVRSATGKTVCGCGEIDLVAVVVEQSIVLTSSFSLCSTTHTRKHNLTSREAQRSSSAPRLGRWRRCATSWGSFRW